MTSPVSITLTQALDNILDLFVLLILDEQRSKKYGLSPHNITSAHPLKPTTLTPILIQSRKSNRYGTAV